MKKILIIIYILFIASNAFALSISRVKEWAAAEVLTAAALNAEFDNIVDHAIVNADVAAAAAIAGSKIDFTVSPAIGSTTANTGAFTTLSASSTFTLGGTDITSSAAELNILDGVTATTAELNYIDGVTSAIQTQIDTKAPTASPTFTTNITIGSAGINEAELEIIDGATLTTTELNYVDGVTSAIQTQIDGKSATAGNTSLVTVGTITTGTWSATDVAVTAGGTGSSTAANARTALGLAIGTNVQAYDAQLDDLADGSLSGAGTCDTSALTGTTYLPDDTADTTALKTATSTSTHATTTYTQVAFTGGQYSFVPQIHSSDATAESSVIDLCTHVHGISNVAKPTSAASQIGFYSSNSYTLTATNRYVTASGTDYWIWMLVDKNTGEIQTTSVAPDHISYGNSDDPEKCPHPFIKYWSEPLPNNLEIILIDMETSEELIRLSGEDRRNASGKISKFICEEYKPDFTKKEVFKPRHSGKFNSLKPVMIETIPDYIKVRKLTKLTAQDKQEREIRKQQKEVERLQEKQERENKIKVLKQKLNITDSEWELLKGEK